MIKLKRCPSDFLETARWRFVNVLELSASPEEVFDCITDNDLEKQWFPNFVEAEWQTPPPHGANSLRLYRLNYLQILEEFLVWERGEHLRFQLIESSWPLVQRLMEDYRFEPMANGGTKMSWQVVYEPHLLTRAIHPILRLIFDRDFRKAARQFGDLVHKKYG